MGFARSPPLAPRSVLSRCRCSLPGASTTSSMRSPSPRCSHWQPASTSCAGRPRACSSSSNARARRSSRASSVSAPSSSRARSGSPCQTWKGRLLETNGALADMLGYEQSEELRGVSCGASHAPRRRGRDRAAPRRAPRGAPRELPAGEALPAQGRERALGQGDRLARSRRGRERRSFLSAWSRTCPSDATPRPR